MKKKTVLAQLPYYMVYITEAHAADTWPMKWSIEWNRPKDIAQRIEYAKICASDLLLTENIISFVVDDMNDEFNSKFGSWPTAYYVVSPQAEMLYIGEPGETEASYDIRLMFKFLSNWQRNGKTKSNDDTFRKD